MVLSDSTVKSPISLSTPSENGKTGNSNGDSGVVSSGNNNVSDFKGSSLDGENKEDVDLDVAVGVSLC